MKYMVMALNITALLCSCADGRAEEKKGGQNIVNTEQLAIAGSLPDIEKVLRYYEVCSDKVNKKECDSKLEYWVKIGVAFDEVGATSIRINEISDIDTCEGALETLLLIKKIRPKIENRNGKYKYLYILEEGVAKRRVISLCSFGFR